jgi:hypothetical protein
MLRDSLLAHSPRFNDLLVFCGLGYGPSRAAESPHCGTIPGPLLQLGGPRVYAIPIEDFRVIYLAKRADDAQAYADEFNRLEAENPKGYVAFVDMHGIVPRGKRGAHARHE